MTMIAANGNPEAVAMARANLSVRFTPEEKKIILDTCCGGASESEARALLAIAEARGLNPLLGECYFVKRWDSQARCEKWAVQASIDSLRIKAEQTGLYAGQDEPEYEHDKEGRLVLARVRVHRKDWTRPAVATARWGEYVQTTKDGAPTRFWQRMPYNQLAKCAEALALRKAFPAVLAKLYVPEEMAQAEVVDEALERSEPKPPPAPQLQGPKPAAAKAEGGELVYKLLESRIKAAMDKGSMDELKNVAQEIAGSTLARDERQALFDIYDLAAASIEGSR